MKLLNNYNEIKNWRKLKIKCVILSFFLSLLYFVSNSHIYAYDFDNFYDSSESTQYLIPIGNIIQIDANLKNVIVKGNIDNTPFKVGDTILTIKNNKIDSFEKYNKVLNSLEVNINVPILINRNSQLLTVYANKDNLNSISCNNILSGFATLTYINPQNNEFGAVGHGITMGRNKLNIKDGYISNTQNIYIQKSYRGDVGCLSGEKSTTIGNFNRNEKYGINGNVTSFSVSKLPKYKVAKLNEIHTGKAQIILNTTSSDNNKYDIEITKVENQNKPDDKTFKLKITDKRLLNKTGGIVQGMSGTPIIQDNKIIGAISHAIENDPCVGYGVYIKWMLEQ